MGRYYYNRKATMEESCGLSIYRLKKWGLLAGQQSTTIKWTRSMTGKQTVVSLSVDTTTDDPYVRFIYTFTERDDDKTDYDYEVSLLTTPCYFGGVRYWFACLMCGRRVGCLYLMGAGYFLCRHCNDLTYQSRSRSVMALFGHTSRQVDKLRSEIKRWTWRGRPTRKVRKLHILERKEGILASQSWKQVEKLTARISKH